jgi:hypothetical protein
MIKTSLVVAALFAASSAFAENTPAPKASVAPVAAAEVVKQAGGQSSGAPAVAGGVAQSQISPALIVIGVAVAAIVVAASLDGDEKSGH